MSEARDTLEAGIERYRKTLDNNAAQAADDAVQQLSTVSAPGLPQGDSLASPPDAASPQGGNG